jgi:hypothetical protein
LVMEGVVGGLGDNRPLARRSMRTRDEVSSANERARLRTEKQNTRSFHWRRSPREN